MKLGDIDPRELREWAEQAWGNSSPDESVELHVTGLGWELRAPREEPRPLQVWPEGNYFDLGRT